jgi:hypothetical protein
MKPVNVRMFRIVISSEAAAQQAKMFVDGGQSPPIIGPLPELPLPPPLELLRAARLLRVPH